MSYVVVFWLNLILAILIMIGSYYLAVNEVKMAKRFLLTFFSFSCTLEVAILCFYIPWTAPNDISDLTLMLAKLILKPAMLGIVVYNIRDQSRKIKRSEPHGQRATLLPQPLEVVKHNQEAAAKGVIDKAVETAKELNVAEEAARKLNGGGYGNGTNGGKHS